MNTFRKNNPLKLKKLQVNLQTFESIKITMQMNTESQLFVKCKINCGEGIAITKRI